MNINVTDVDKHSKKWFDYQRRSLLRFAPLAGALKLVKKSRRLDPLEILFQDLPVQSAAVVVHTVVSIERVNPRLTVRQHPRKRRE